LSASPRLVRVEAGRGGAAIVFQVNDRGESREASVLTSFVQRRPVFAFPHPADERGRPLASPSADAILLDRAQQFVTFAEAVRDWVRLVTAGGRQ
jgi:hypothetical protein